MSQVLATARAPTPPAQAGPGIAACVMWAGPVQGAETLPQISIPFALLPWPGCGSGASQDFCTV